MTYSGNCHLGDLFTSRREKGVQVLPTLSVTLNDGLVNREDLDRKQGTELTPEEHLLVKPGDIAYNMMRMWQGAFGLADRAGLVSPAYVVLKPKKGIVSFVCVVLAKDETNHLSLVGLLLWPHRGPTSPLLSGLCKSTSEYSPKSVQERIAAQLATWDEAISVCEKLRKCQ